MKVHNNQSGFSVFELVLVVVVLTGLAVVGLKVMTARNNQGLQSSSNQSTKQASDVSSAPAINKDSDLNKAVNTLDQNDPDAANKADSNQLNGELN
jgi:Tfp pilus assembly protein PilV